LPRIKLTVGKIYWPRFASILRTSSTHLSFISPVDRDLGGAIDIVANKHQRAEQRARHRRAHAALNRLGGVTIILLAV